MFCCDGICMLSAWFVAKLTVLLMVAGGLCGRLSLQTANQKVFFRCY
jgi:hypothetical protein